ncbi:MAG TPA: hypothetical protein VG871_02610 [Vicinamibacterales bacterium]|nr:hypothetical protein [Vicinamibacterales bacterium]
MLPVALLLAMASQPASASANVRLRITQKYLAARCLDGVSVKPGTRTWTLAPGEHTLTMTMNNQPRTGIASDDAGVARVRFTLASGHRYEVEARGPAGSYSLRVWKKGDWVPAVRDRSDDRVVSGDAEWLAGGACKGQQR